MAATPGFLSRPVVRASLTSGFIMAAGDVLCQAIRTKGAGKPLKIDGLQTARFALVGATLHGPFFYHGFRWLDSSLGTAKTLQKALLKTAVGQVTLFPVYTASFFTYMGLLEGLSPRQCVAKVKQAVPRALLTGSVFWPSVNVFNFMLVPPGGRVAYVNVCGLFWNAYLSYTNTTYGQAGSSPAAAVTEGSKAS